MSDLTAIGIGIMAGAVGSALVEFMRGNKNLRYHIFVFCVGVGVAIGGAVL